VELAIEAHAEGLARPPAAVGSLTRWRPAQVQAPVPAPSGSDFMLDSPTVPELTPASAPDDEPASQPDGAGPGVFANAPAPASTLPRRKIDDAVVRRSAYRILFERAPGEVRTAAALRAALADKGIAVDEAAAGRLLREFDAPGERRAGEATAAAELLTALTNHGITVNLRTARRLLREFDAPGARKPGEARTPEELQVALANHGITVNLRTATHLVREFDLPRGDRRWKVAGRAD